MTKLPDLTVLYADALFLVNSNDEIFLSYKKRFLLTYLPPPFKIVKSLKKPFLKLSVVCYKN
jgi:hypothetical protein